MTDVSKKDKSMSSTDFQWNAQAILQAGQSRLQNKRILLGVTGGIACYKSLELCRLLIKAGAQVRVVMTEGALAFIQPLAFQALTGHEPHVHLLDSSAEAGMGHIELAKWADLIFVSPCTANQMARFAQGLADDLLGTLVLATTAPVVIAPAMNQQMWKHPATQRNLRQLKEDGVHIIEPAEGAQACGDVGPGRAQEPQVLFQHAQRLLTPQVLAGKTVLITAGPTREPIDPVRFISNHSSGLMGYCLAQAAADAGATVTLISGPSHCTWPQSVQGQYVESAQDMLEACLSKTGYDIIIGTAAVSDFRPANSGDKKLSKQDLEQSIQLVENRDIIAALSDANPQAIKVGFAAQTHDVISYAQKKLVKKGLDLICANDVSDKSIGFNSPNNEISLISTRTSDIFSLAKAPKAVLAQSIIAALAQL